MKGTVKFIAVAVAVVAVMAISLTAESRRGSSRCGSCGDRIQTQGGFMRVVDLKEDEVLVIFDGPGPDYKKIGQIPANGVCVALLSTCGCKWLQVEYEDVVGYVNSSYLVPDRSGRCGGCDRGPCGNNLKVTGVRNNLNVRTGPGTDYDQVCKIPAGETCIEYIDECGDWYQIRWMGFVGWAHSRYLTEDNSCCQRCNHYR